MHKFNENGLIGFRFDRINNSNRYSSWEYYRHVTIESDSDSISTRFSIYYSTRQIRNNDENKLPSNCLAGNFVRIVTAESGAFVVEENPIIKL